MQTHDTYDFKKVPPSCYPTETLSTSNIKLSLSSNRIHINKSFASDPLELQNLYRFVVEFFNDDNSHNLYDIYDIMIETAIKHSNLLGLHILWRGIYHHGSHPIYKRDLKFAVQYGDLNMVKYVYNRFLYANAYLSEEDDLKITYSKLKQLAISNSNVDVIEFVDSLLPYVKNGKYINRLSEDEL